MTKLFASILLLATVVCQAAPLGNDPVFASTSAMEKTKKEKGTIKWFNEIKGFGFITKEDGSDIFFQYRYIAGSSTKELKAGDKVQFEISQGLKGYTAINVQHDN